MSSSSLNDTKWRNENTGDWEIGFFENFAVYDCKFWNYENIDGKGDKFEIKLRNEGDLIVINIDKEKNGKRIIQNRSEQATAIFKHYESAPPVLS